MIQKTFRLSIVAATIATLAGCSLINKIPMQFGTNHPASDEVSMPDIKEIADGACQPAPGTPFAYRKAIHVAGTVGVPDVARDLPGLANLTSRRLQTHLESAQRFNVTAKHDASFTSSSEGAAQLVMEYGVRHESQFVVKVDLLDLTVYPVEGRFPKLLGTANKRNILMKLYIYDAENGALFYSGEYQDSVSGNVIGYRGTGSEVTATYWSNTTLGEKIDHMLEMMSRDIRNELACIPFSAKVSATRGNDIHINAGFLNGLQSGQNLRIYRRSEVKAADGSPMPANDEWIKVLSVFPSSSIVGVNTGVIILKPLEVGDVLRAW